MKSIYTETAEISIKDKISWNDLNRLPEEISKRTMCSYSCYQTEKGCFLKPQIHNRSFMAFRNDFVPEMDIVVSHNDSVTILNISGQPVKGTRIIGMVISIICVIMEVIIITRTKMFDLNNIFLYLFPIGMIILNFLFSKISTKITFKKVVKAIQIALK